MKRNVSTPGFSRLTRLDSSTNVQEKDLGGLEERRLSSFFFEVQVSSNVFRRPSKAGASNSLILGGERGGGGGEPLAFCATSGALASMPMSSL